MRPAAFTAAIVSLIWLIWRKSAWPDCCPNCCWEKEDDE